MTPNDDSDTDERSKPKPREHLYWLLVSQYGVLLLFAIVYQIGRCVLKDAKSESIQCDCFYWVLLVIPWLGVALITIAYVLAYRSQVPPRSKETKNEDEIGEGHLSQNLEEDAATLSKAIDHLQEVYHKHIEIKLPEGLLHALALFWWTGLLWSVIDDMASDVALTTTLGRVGMGLVALLCSAYAGLFAPDLQVLKVATIRSAFTSAWRSLMRLSLPPTQPVNFEDWSAYDLEVFIAVARKYAAALVAAQK